MRGEEEGWGEWKRGRSILRVRVGAGLQLSRSEARCTTEAKGSGRFRGELVWSLLVSASSTPLAHIAMRLLSFEPCGVAHLWLSTWRQLLCSTTSTTQKMTTREGR